VYDRTSHTFSTGLALRPDGSSGSGFLPGDRSNLSPFQHHVNCSSFGRQRRRYYSRREHILIERAPGALGDGGFVARHSVDGTESRRNAAWVCSAWCAASSTQRASRLVQVSAI